MFVVMRVQDWTFESTGLAAIIPFKIDVGKAIGFLPVYATREDALVDYPDSNVAEVREITQQERQG